MPSDAVRRIVHNFNNNLNRPQAYHHGNCATKGASVTKIFLFTCSKLMTEAVHRVTPIVTKPSHDRRDKITEPLRYRGQPAHSLIIKRSR